ncbi:MAG TPA: hypothetical protein VGV59_19705 [Pyrinomonadaceae bacterium]|nr:hypothetical protein [Pyrinomonadaceae bacterium]
MTAKAAPDGLMREAGSSVVVSDGVVCGFVSGGATGSNIEGVLRIVAGEVLVAGSVEVALMAAG